MVHKLKQSWPSQFDMLSGLTRHHAAVRFEVLSSASVKISGLWDVAPQLVNNVLMEPAGSERFVV